MSLEATHLRTSTALRVAVTIRHLFPDHCVCRWHHFVYLFLNAPLSRAHVLVASNRPACESARLFGCGALWDRCMRAWPEVCRSRPGTPQARAEFHQAGAQ